MENVVLSGVRLKDSETDKMFNDASFVFLSPTEYRTTMQEHLTLILNSDFILPFVQNKNIITVGLNSLVIRYIVSQI